MPEVPQAALVGVQSFRLTNCRLDPGAFNTAFNEHIFSMLREDESSLGHRR